MTETAVVVADDVQAARPLRVGVLRPAASPADLLEMMATNQHLIAEGLTEGLDYGQIPGTGAKPILLQPGAEKLCAAYDVAPIFEVLEAEKDHCLHFAWSYQKKRGGDWETVSGESDGLYRYVVRCRLLLRSTGEIVGEAIGSCSSMEDKYVSRPRNTEYVVLAMAQKRAFVSATKGSFGLSQIFTVEFEPDPADDARSGDRPRASAPRTSGGSSGGSRSGGGGRGTGGIKQIRSNFANQCPNCGSRYDEGATIEYNFDTKRVLRCPACWNGTAAPESAEPDEDEDDPFAEE